MIFFNRNNSNLPRYFKNYLELVSDEGYSDSIISLDIETTDMDYKKGEIISYGSVILEGRVIMPSTQKHLFFQSDNMASDNIKIHEILAHSEGGKFLDALEEVIANIGNKIILGHYIIFDINMINAKLKSIKYPRIKNPRYDTLELALKKDRVHDLSTADRNKYSLYALCKTYNIPIVKVHDALEDAYLTALLYLHLT